MWGNLLCLCYGGVMLKMILMLLAWKEPPVILRWLKLPDVFIVFISVHVLYSIIFLLQFLSFPEKPINSYWFCIQITPKAQMLNFWGWEWALCKAYFILLQRESKNCYVYVTKSSQGLSWWWCTMWFMAGEGFLQFNYLNDSKYNNYSHKPHNILK